ncbi:MAG: DUF2752 domain-containing protein [Clostridiales bacterium]|nr:DUF2752 domain-containing protein [Clostridiales bacterium]
MRVRVWVTVLLLGIAYLIWLRITGLGIPCPIRSITGWLCPGCGITTLFVRLFQGDIKGAFDANPFIFCTGPLLIAILMTNEYIVLTPSRDHKRLKLILEIVCIVYVIALIVFGILRNVIS